MVNPSSSKKKCIAVDIDNVLARAEFEVQRLFRELTGTPWPPGRYGSAGGLDSSEFERALIEEIFSRFHEESIPRLPVFPGARVALELLHRFYRIIIVTARRPTSRPQTLEWLRNHRIPFDALYHSEDKTAIPEPMSVAIDDHPEHIRGYQDLGLRVFIMDQPWNKHVGHPQVVRVDGWDAFLQYVFLDRSSSWSSPAKESASFSSRIRQGLALVPS